MATTAINPRTLFQLFLNAPLTKAIVSGTNVSGAPAAIGEGFWNINAKATFNGNANSVPILMHNISCSSIAATAYPNYFDTALWFDYATGALIGVSDYGSNREISARGGFNQRDWMIESTKTLNMPNQTFNVDFATSTTIYTGTSANITFKRSIIFSPTGEGDAYAVGAAFTPTGFTMSARVSLATVGIANTLRLRYAITTTVSGSSNVSNFDFYFNTNGFSYAEFPSSILVKTNATTWVRTPTIMKWTAVSGF